MFDKGQSPRFKGAFLIIWGFLFAILGGIWVSGDWRHQSLKLISSFLTVGGMLLLALFWFFFVSPFKLKTRVVVLVLLVALLVSGFNFVEIRGVSGDVMPILSWTWVERADEGLINETMTAEGKAVVALPASNDFPRFLGLHSSGVIHDLNLAQDWALRAPLEKWRIPVGSGWSGFAVQGGLAITQEQRGESEMVTCYNLNTGELVWAHSDPQYFASTVGGDGPRATPTIAGTRVYTQGAMGLLNCLELATGQLIWQKNIAEDNSAEKPLWGYASSPLVFSGSARSETDFSGGGPSASETGSELVVVSPGGPSGRSLVAYFSGDGSFAWAGGSTAPGYSSPELANLADSQMILIFNNGSVAAHSPDTGQIFWEEPWPGGKACVANPRSLSGDRVLVSAGYGIGAKMFRISRDQEHFSVETLYRTPRLKAKFANFMVQGDFAYGLDDGVLTCVDTNSGDRVWKAGRYGHGQLLLVDKLLLVQAEDGELHLVEASPEAHHELGSFPVLAGKSWNTMALAGNLLLMRNHKEAVCLELPVN